MVRLSKGAGFTDAYAPLSRPLTWFCPAGMGHGCCGFGGAVAYSCWKTTTVACALCWSCSNKDQSKETFPLP